MAVDVRKRTMTGEGDKKAVRYWGTHSIRCTAWVLAAALLAGLYFAVNVPPAPQLHDARDHDQLARSLLDGKGFSRPDGTPTAARAPLYPAFVAAVYLFCGGQDSALFLIQGILFALTCVLVFFIGRKIYGPRIGVTAGLAAAFYPMLLFPVVDRLSEGLFAFLFTLTLFVLLKARQSHRLSFCAGMLLALASLTKPIALFAFPFFLFWIGMNRGEKRAEAMGLFSLAFVMALLPWTIRNCLVFGAFVPITTGGGLALYNSYILPPQGLGFNTVEGVPSGFFSLENEAAQSRFLAGLALDYIIDHPLAAARLELLKILLLFYPFDGQWYGLSLGSKYNIFWGLVLSFGVAGFSRPAIEPRGRQLLLVSVLAIGLGCIVFIGIPRYRLVLEPVFLMLAAAGLSDLWQRSKASVFWIAGVNALLWALFRSAEAGAFLRWSVWSGLF